MRCIVERRPFRRSNLRLARLRRLCSQCCTRIAADNTVLLQPMLLLERHYRLTRVVAEAPVFGQAVALCIAYTETVEVLLQRLNFSAPRAVP